MFTDNEEYMTKPRKTIKARQKCGFCLAVLDGRKLNMDHFTGACTVDKNGIKIIDHRTKGI